MPVDYGIKIIGAGGTTLLSSDTKALCFRQKLTGTVVSSYEGTTLYSFAVDATDTMFTIQSVHACAIVKRAGNTIYVIDDGTGTPVYLYCFNPYGSATPSGYGVAVYNATGEPTYASNRKLLAISGLVSLTTNTGSVAIDAPTDPAIFVTSMALKIETFTHSYLTPVYECGYESQNVCGYESVCGYENVCGYVSVYVCNYVCSWDYGSQTNVCNYVCGYENQYQCNNVYQCHDEYLCNWQDVYVCNWVDVQVNENGNRLYREAYYIENDTVKSKYLLIGRVAYTSSNDPSSNYVGFKYESGIAPSGLLPAGTYGQSINNVMVIDRSVYA